MILSQLLKEIEYKVLSGEPCNTEISSVCNDSRTAESGALFVCISGAANDGHKFAEIAYKLGCRAFLVQRPIDLPNDACVVLTDDTRKGLAAVSAEFYGKPSEDLILIGITGTKGKTTTALTVYHILNTCGISTAYIGSNGIRYCEKQFKTSNTTPESLELQRQMRAMKDAGVRCLVMEVSSQAVYMERIHGIKFDVVAFTNLYPDHIGGAEHPTFEHYRDCKKRLFTDFGAYKVIYNADDPHAEYMISDCNAEKTSCSPSGNTADMWAENVCRSRHGGRLSVEFTLRSKEKNNKVYMPMPGEFSVANATIAIAICNAVGIEIEKAADAIESVVADGRFETLELPTGALFIIDYAHNGASLTAALKAIREYEPERLICLFGSVGGRTKDRRRELGEAAAALADLCILTADNPDSEPPEDIINDIAVCFNASESCPYVAIPDRRDAIRFAVANAKKGDVVLLAGKGHEDYQLISGKKIPFSERAIIMEAISEFSGVR